MPFGLIMRFSWRVAFLFGSGGSFPLYEGRSDYHHFLHSLWNVLVEAFCQLRVVNPVHELGDLHALKGSLHAPSLHFEAFHEILEGLSIPLFDIVDFHWIFHILLLLHEIC
ncbi:hypothetical protein Tco_1350440 [Tanacetum coccineum]